MSILKQIMQELKKRFPLVYTIYVPPSREKLFIFCQGKESKKIKEEIEKFLKGKNLSAELCYYFSEKKVTIDQQGSKIYN